mmetsp:Transcript_30414/g.75955  ORF Transcript_30414/g.75955 Transcript_30414/m.75955 type:complete len:107 (+) Transcript_30414:986-1306(+)
MAGCHGHFRSTLSGAAVHVFHGHSSMRSVRTLHTREDLCSRENASLSVIFLSSSGPKSISQVTNLRGSRAQSGQADNLLACIQFVFLLFLFLRVLPALCVLGRSLA